MKGKNNSFLIILGIILLLTALINIRIFIWLVVIIVIYKGLKKFKAEKKARERKEREKNRISYGIPKEAKILKIVEFYYKDISLTDINTLWWVNDNRLKIVSKDIEEDFNIIEIPMIDISYFATFEQVYNDLKEHDKLGDSKFSDRAFFGGSEYSIMDIQEINLDVLKKNQLLVKFQLDEEVIYIYLEPSEYDTLVQLIPSKEFKNIK